MKGKGIETEKEIESIENVNEKGNVNESVIEIVNGKEELGIDVLWNGKEKENVNESEKDLGENEKENGREEGCLHHLEEIDDHLHVEVLDDVAPFRQGDRVPVRLLRIVNVLLRIEDQVPKMNVANEVNQIPEVPLHLSVPQFLPSSPHPCILQANKINLLNRKQCNSPICSGFHELPLHLEKIVTLN